MISRSLGDMIEELESPNNREIHEVNRIKVKVKLIQGT